MPELPEVRTVVSSLNKHVRGKKIAKVLVFLPKLIKNANGDEFKEALKGRTIKSVKNLGKFIIFEFDKDIYVVSHLRMEGKYHTEEWVNKKHDYISFIFSDKSFLIYNDTRQFGTMHLFKSSPYNEKPLIKVANEPSSVDIDKLYKKLQGKRVAIKSALLDQTLVAGLGNIYVNEVLWATKINPMMASNQVTLKQLKQILATSTKIMDLSTKMGGTTISSYSSVNGKEGKFQQMLKVHGKKSEKCLSCGEEIKKIKVNGRGTYYCPRCQKTN